MKYLATLLLVCLCCTTARADFSVETNCTSVITTTNGQKSIAVLCFITGCTVVGAYMIWKVNGCTPSQTNPVTFVLEKTKDHQNWIPVQTNTVTLHGVAPIEFFRESMTDDMAFYRTRWVKNP